MSEMSRSDLEHLVYSAYAVCSITEGKACELLGLDRLQIRDGLQSWLAKQPQYIKNAEAFVRNHVD